MQDATQITTVAAHGVKEYQELELGQMVLDRYEKIATSLDRAALHLKYDTRFEEHEALLESFRKVIDGTKSIESLRDNLRSDDYEVSKFLDELEKRIISTIDAAYKHASLKPELAAEVAKSLSALSDHIKLEMDDLFMLLEEFDSGDN